MSTYKEDNVEENQQTLGTPFSTVTAPHSLLLWYLQRQIKKTILIFAKR